jgi:hypothetical protein
VSSRATRVHSSTGSLLPAPTATHGLAV